MAEFVYSAFLMSHSMLELFKCSLASVVPAFSCTDAVFNFLGGQRGQILDVTTHVITASAVAEPVTSHLHFIVRMPEQEKGTEQSKSLC